MQGIAIGTFSFVCSTCFVYFLLNLGKLFVPRMISFNVGHHTSSVLKIAVPAYRARHSVAVATVVGHIIRDATLFWKGIFWGCFCHFHIWVTGLTTYLLFLKKGLSLIKEIIFKASLLYLSCFKISALHLGYIRNFRNIWILLYFKSPDVHKVEYCYFTAT